MHRYFVSYSYSGFSGWGFGNCVIDCDRPIETIEDTDVTKRNIEATTHLSDVIVLNFVLLKMEAGGGSRDVAPARSPDLRAEKLMQYVAHSPDCDKDPQRAVHADENACTCGLNKLLGLTPREN